MNLQIKEIQKVCDYQRLEREIYDLDNFNHQVACFPKQVFKKKYDKYYFLKDQDWFHLEVDYDRLLSFVRQVGSTTFIASCPPYYMINAIEVPLSATSEDYISSHTYSEMENHEDKGVGIRKAHETFFYDEAGKWAIVSDFLHGIMIVGVDKEVITPFQEHFQGLYSDIERFITDLEIFQNGEMSDKINVIKRYS